MKTNQILYFIGALITICVLTSCDKKTRAYKKANQIMSCSADAGYDSLGLANALAGRWKWIDEKSEIKFQKADRAVILEIIAGGELVLQDANSGTEKGTWALSSKSNTFCFETDLNSGFLTGDVYVCDDELIITTRNLDGPEYRYQRSKTE